MNSVQTQEAELSNHHHRHHNTVTVKVNRKPVKFHVHEATGREIKETAIREGVDIKPDFALFEILPHGGKRQIRDDEVVCLHEDEHFRALTPDDNS